MLKKRIFALASVTALTGLVASATSAGCSSSDSPGTTTGDASVPDVREAKAPFDASEPEEDAGPSNCPITDKIDAKMFPWKPPAVAQGSCTDDEIKTLAKAVDDNAKITYADLKKAVPNVTCNKCLFGPESGMKWTAMLEDGKGEFSRHNFGGCVAVLSGSDDCGKAFSQYDECLNTACDMCADQTAFDKCSTPASKGACKQSLADLQSICGDKIDAVSGCQDLSVKYLFESAARALCVGTGDGGVDGGDDGGDGGDGG